MDNKPGVTRKKEQTTTATGTHKFRVMKYSDIVCCFFLEVPPLHKQLFKDFCVYSRAYVPRKILFFQLLLLMISCLSTNEVREREIKQYTMTN